MILNVRNSLQSNIPFNSRVEIKQCVYALNKTGHLCGIICPTSFSFPFNGKLIMKATGICFVFLLKVPLAICIELNDFMHNDQSGTSKVFSFAFRLLDFHDYTVLVIGGIVFPMCPANYSVFGMTAPSFLLGERATRNE